MQIIYKENPLETVIELSAHEKEILWYKVKCDELLLEHIMSAELRLREGEYFNLKEAREYLDSKYFFDKNGMESMDSGINKRATELQKHYIDQLRASHIGDCTCQPCSCSKCAAEEYLGIDTIFNLGKHPGHYIEVAFSRDKKRNIHEAIEWLRDYKAHADWEGWEAHAERWKQEASDAHDWLVKYRDEHIIQSPAIEKL